MRRIGLIGGMSWESSAIYYRIINETVRDRLGGMHSADLAMISLDFAPIAAAQADGEWDRLEALMIAAARDLERAGAGCVLIATNTMHRLYDAVAAAIAVPMIHIGDCTGRESVRSGYKRPALLGTRFTMEGGIYRDRLAGAFGLDCRIPEHEEDRAAVHRIIYDELVQGVVRDESRAAIIAIIDRLASDGCDSVILGCTELPMLIDADNAPLPPIDTTRLHALAAVDFALATGA